MSIAGETIDYGPCAFMDAYHPATVYSSIDEGGRYAFGNQPRIAQWNLARLAESLIPLVEVTQLESGLQLFASTFQDGWNRALAHKLGLAALDRPGDEELVSGLFRALAAAETDFTIFFRNLAVDQPTIEALRPAFYTQRPADDPLVPWLKAYRERPRSLERMKKANPKYVFRNYLAVQAIEALERGDASVLERLMRVLERPYDEQPEHRELAARRPDWARDRAGCSALSCSS